MSAYWETEIPGDMGEGRERGELYLELLILSPLE